MIQKPDGVSKETIERYISERTKKALNAVLSDDCGKEFRIEHIFAVYSLNMNYAVIRYLDPETPKEFQVQFRRIHMTPFDIIVTDIVSSYELSEVKRIWDGIQNYHDRHILDILYFMK